MTGRAIWCKHGLDLASVPAALQVFAAMAEDLEAALSGSDWIVGERYSLVDADYTPYLQRLTDLGLESLWADKPALSAPGFERGDRARPSFLGGARRHRCLLSPQELDIQRHGGGDLRMARSGPRGDKRPPEPREGRPG